MKPNNKILVIAVIVLLLINLALLFFMWKGKHPDQLKRQSSSNSTETMARELNMTDSQKTAYQEFRDEYFANVRPLYDSIRGARKEFLKMIQSLNLNDSDLKIYSNRIAEKQAVIDRMTLDHFRKVRTIFIGEQQEKYDDFIQKMFLRRRDTTNRRK